MDRIMIIKIMLDLKIMVVEDIVNLIIDFVQAQFVDEILFSKRLDIPKNIFAVLENVMDRGDRLYTDLPEQVDRLRMSEKNMKISPTITRLLNSLHYQYRAIELFHDINYGRTYIKEHNRYIVESNIYKNRVHISHKIIEIVGGEAYFSQIFHEITFYFCCERNQQSQDVIRLICKHKNMSITSCYPVCMPTYKITEDRYWTIQCSYWNNLRKYTGIIIIHANGCQ